VVISPFLYMFMVSHAVKSISNQLVPSYLSQTIINTTKLNGENIQLSLSPSRDIPKSHSSILLYFMNFVDCSVHSLNEQAIPTINLEFIQHNFQRFHWNWFSHVQIYSSAKSLLPCLRIRRARQGYNSHWLNIMLALKPAYVLRAFNPRHYWHRYIYGGMLVRF
jgi:hypothetical protein